MSASGLGRSLYVGLKADTKGFGRSLSAAEKRMKMFKNGVKILGTAVAASFAAMGAAALLFGKSAITAALEDQKSQIILAKTIKNNARARKGLIKDSEKTISALESQFHIVDDKLRPAFGKLVTATKSVSKSQKLIRVAIDVSAQSGKSLDSVVTALSRAYLGSNTALSKLGLGIDKAKLKTMTFDQIIKTLSQNTGGAGKAAAGSYQGAVDGLSIAWKNFQEGVGYKILPKLKTLLEYIQGKVVPWLGNVKKGFDDVGAPNTPATKLGKTIKTMATSFEDLFKALSSSDAKGSPSFLTTMASALTTIADAITTSTNAAKGFVNWAKKDGFWQNGVITLPSGRKFDVTPWTQDVPKSKPNATKSSGVNRSMTQIKPSSYNRGGDRNVTINLNGIVDAESARRSIENLMQKSSKRTGQVNLNGFIF